MVCVTLRPWMRDPNLEYTNYIGYSVLQTLFDTEIVDPNVKSFVLYHPERHLNIVEERSLFNRMAHLLPNLKDVQIFTQSVYIMQTVERENIRIIGSEDDGCQQESTTGRLWNKNVHTRDFTKLQVF